MFWTAGCRINKKRLESFVFSNFQPQINRLPQLSSLFFQELFALLIIFMFRK